MSEISNEAIQSQIDQRGLKVGNRVLDTDGTDVTASKPVYVDSSSKLASGSIPFELTFSGVRTTASAVIDLQASSQASADELMHATFVQGGNGGKGCESF